MTCTFSGNYKPLTNPIFLITNPNKKGCKELAKLMGPREFIPKDWSNLKVSAKNITLALKTLKNKIIKLAKTSKLRP